MNVTIEKYNGSIIGELSYVIVEAMQTNPLHLVAFGAPAEKSRNMQIELFSLLLGMPSCNLFIARIEEQIVGVMNYYLPGKCQLSPIKTLSLFPRLSSILGYQLIPVLRWKKTWARQDPKAVHLHFGPLAVLPGFQGKGIGSAMLSHFCEYADGLNLLSYLETDKEENVSLYKRFGFRILHTVILLGVTNWFMFRPPQTFEPQ